MALETGFASRVQKFCLLWSFCSIFELISCWKQLQFQSWRKQSSMQFNTNSKKNIVGVGSGHCPMVRSLASHQCGSGLIPGPAVIHMWVEIAVGSRPCSKGFSPGSPVFLPPKKPTLPNSNSIVNPRATGLLVA